MTAAFTVNSLSLGEQTVKFLRPETETSFTNPGWEEPPSPSWEPWYGSQVKVRLQVGESCWFWSRTVFLSRSRNRGPEGAPLYWGMQKWARRQSFWLRAGSFLKTTARNVKGGCSPAARSTRQIIGQITTLRILQACPSTGGHPKAFPLVPRWERNMREAARLSRRGAEVNSGVLAGSVGNGPGLVAEAEWVTQGPF